MKFLIVLFLTTSISASPTNHAVVFNHLKGSRIINGTSAVEGQIPWQVSNRFTTSFGSYFCGGALISERWVLTAAHCVINAIYFQITLGSIYSSNANNEGTVLLTTQGFPNEAYNPFTLNNDVGLINLGQNIQFTDTIQAIPLGSDYMEDGVTVTVSGWGKTSDNSNSVSPILKYVELVTISNDECKSIYGSSVTKKTVCCRGVGQKNTCNGDSGGPLTQKLEDGKIVHVGVVSFGHVSGCCTGYPAGLSRTSEYRDWINEISGI